MINGSASPIEPGRLNTKWTPLFWSFASAAAAMLPSTIRGFGDVQGLNGITPNMTNMNKANELSAPEVFMVNAFRMVFIGCGAADVQQFFKNYTTRFYVSGIKLLDAPAEFWPGGLGNPQDGGNNGIVDARNVMDISGNPIRLEAGSNFKTECVGVPFAPVNAFFMRIYLEGPYSQPIG